MDSFSHKGQTVSMWDMLQLPVKNVGAIYKDYREKHKRLMKQLEEVK